MSKKIKYMVGQSAVVFVFCFLCAFPVDARICFAPSGNCDDNFGTRVDNCDKHNWQEDENCDAGQIAVAKEIINGVQCYACEQRKTCADHGYPFSEEPCGYSLPAQSVYDVHLGRWQYFCCAVGEEPVQVVVDDLICYECQTPSNNGYNCTYEYFQKCRNYRISNDNYNCEYFCRNYCHKEGSSCVGEGGGSEFQRNCCSCADCFTPAGAQQECNTPLNYRKTCDFM